MAYSRRALPRKYGKGESRSGLGSHSAVETDPVRFVEHADSRKSFGEEFGFVEGIRQGADARTEFATAILLAGECHHRFALGEKPARMYLPVYPNAPLTAFKRDPIGSIVLSLHCEAPATWRVVRGQRRAIRGRETGNRRRAGGRARPGGS
jgi:hypothetical protein